MICLRCGYCCIHSDVIIIKPEYVNNQILKREHIKKEYLIHKKGGEICPHLKLIDNIPTCTIHNTCWYKYTPCYEYKQTESRNSKCRMGKYIINNDRLKDFIELIKQNEDINGFKT